MMETKPALEQVKGNTYQFANEKCKRMFDNKLDGFNILWEEFQTHSLFAQQALELGLQLKELAIPIASPQVLEQESISREFVAFTDIFEKKIASEKDGKPRLFLCANCGLHAYFVGKQFFWPMDIYCTGQALAAIDWAVRNGFLTHEQGIQMIEEANALVFPPESSVLAMQSMMFD